MEGKSADRMFLVGTGRGSFRIGEPAEIVGVEMIAPEGGLPRPCFKVRFADGREEHTPIFNFPISQTEKNPAYELITEADFRAGRIPTITP